jgi:hypothetical protein
VLLVEIGVIKRRLIWLGGLGAIFGLVRSSTRVEAFTGDPLVLGFPLNFAGDPTRIIGTSDLEIVLEVSGEGVAPADGLEARGLAADFPFGSPGTGLVATGGPVGGGTTSNIAGGVGSRVTGGAAEAGQGGAGLFARGGISKSGPGGHGVEAYGGESVDTAGPGLVASGGSSRGVAGARIAVGNGIEAFGGHAPLGQEAGAGVVAQGGLETMPTAVPPDDGHGISASGGKDPTGFQAAGIVAQGGGEGESGAPGVYAEASAEARAGAHGRGAVAGGALGVSKQGNGLGVLGLNLGKGPGGVFTSENGPGLVGTSTSGVAIEATGDASSGLRADSAHGDAAIGRSTNGIGIGGYSTKDVGGYFQTEAADVPAVGATNSKATPAGGVTGVLVNGDFVAQNCTKPAALPTSKGLTLLYIVEATTAVFEDVGKAQLRNGRARVELDPLFAETIETHDYQVFLTARGDNRGLFVAVRDERGFEIREQAGGTSSIDVSYRIVAQRKGLHPNHRLARFEPPSPPKPPDLQWPKPPKLHQPNLPERPERRSR